MAVQFFRFLQEKVDSEFYLLIVIEMITGINKCLRTLTNAAQDNQTHNANELRD